MNDEVKQIHSETFNYIVSGLALVSLVAGAVVFATGGTGSPWFIGFVALLVGTGVAYGIRLVGRLVVASYLLVLILTGLAAMVFLQSGTYTGFAPYLFIFIVLIAGVLLSPTAVLLITVGIITAVFLFLALVGQLTLVNVSALLLPLGLTFLAGVLSAFNKRNLSLLGNRLVENRNLLKERALELMQAQKRLEFYEQEVAQLKQQLEKAGKSATQLQTADSKEHNHLYALVDGTLSELNTSIINLEQSIEKIGDLPNLNGDHEIFEAAWQKLHGLKSMVVNLEELIQIEHDEFQLFPGKVDVKQLINEVAGTAKGLAREKDIEVRHHVAKDVTVIQADLSRLRQALLHLVSNAIKYTDQGIIELRSEIDQKQLIIFISDSGIGMNEEEANRVFGKFERGDSDIAQQRQGSGLGLAISKRLVNLHGGRMWVSSVLGVGSTFYMALPLKSVTQPVKVVERAGGKTTVRLGKFPIGASGKKRVLRPRELTPDEKSALVSGRFSPRLGGKGKNDSTRQPEPFSKKTSTNVDDGATVFMPPPADRHKHPTQPIHRYQPMYIRRFGFILLGLLLIILIFVLGLALTNQLFFSQESTASTVVLPAKVSISGGAVITSSQELTTEMAALAVSPAPFVVATESPSPSATATATQLPPTPVSTATLARLTPTSTQEASSLVPPTSTSTLPPPTPSATPFSPPTKTAVLLTTALPTQTATPSPVASPAPTVLSVSPAVVVVPGASDNLQVDFGDVSPVGDNRLAVSSVGQVLFGGEQAGRRDIYVASPQGSPKNLTSSVIDDLQPDWSPDGRNIAFSSGRTGSFNVFVMQADGSDPTQLTDSRGFDEWPVWSPNGRQIAFVSDRDGNIELYTMNADGSNQQRLTNHPADDWPAAWSPDGRWLVFASNRDEDWNLYVVSSQGGSATQLTRTPGDERDPMWSPDGTAIAFAYNGGGNWDFYTLPLPSGPITEVPAAEWSQITNTPTDERYPTWGN